MTICVKKCEKNQNKSVCCLLFNIDKINTTGKYPTIDRTISVATGILIL